MMVTDLNAQSLHLSDVTPRLLHHSVPVDIGEQAEAEAVLVVGRVCEAVHQDAPRRGMKGLPHTVVELIVSYGAPVLWFLVTDGPQI